MESKRRMAQAMQLGKPDRVPLMCQLSMGFYFLNSGLNPVEIWCDSQAFAEALVRLQRRFSFDGILVNLPGRSPEWMRSVRAICRRTDQTVVRWKSGGSTAFPKDDNPAFFPSDPEFRYPRFEELDPESLFYVEPWGLDGIHHPYAWEFEEGSRSRSEGFPPYQLDCLKAVQRSVGDSVSVHAEIFSPWSQFLELLGYEAGLVAMLEDSGKVKSCLDRLSEGAIALGRLQASLDVDAILISSAFAGGAFLSPAHYREFVLPYESKVISGIRENYSGPIYTHTCGSIGDRLELMVSTGTNGIDTLDPPPLGNVLLEEAKLALEGKAFIKGNIDPVNTLLKGDRDAVWSDASERLRVGKRGGGYILSSACSVAPHTPPENIEVLREVIEREEQ